MTLRFLTAGESHGPQLTAILDGLPAGLQLDMEAIQVDLKRRQTGYGAGGRMKIEADRLSITAGVMAGATTGGPLALVIQNQDHSKWRGRPVKPFTIPRPGHADLTGAIKYGYRDLRLSLERASARETAARVAIGALCRQFLNQFDIQIGGWVVSIGQVQADLSSLSTADKITLARESELSCPDLSAAETIRAAIRQAMSDGETLGGIIECAVLGLPPGLGSHVQFDRKLEARLGAAILSIPAFKGVEFGGAFENTTLPGSQAHDAIQLEGQNIRRGSNRSGGLEGGITTGQELLLRAAMKPIATTLLPQDSVDLASGQSVKTEYERSDFCPVPRAVVIVEAMLAIILANALLEKLGGDSMEEILPRFAALKQMRLEDLPMDQIEHTWWPE
ncbi:MAG: chorismate synthase [Anaerolineaceae bacterium]